LISGSIKPSTSRFSLQNKKEEQKHDARYGTFKYAEDDIIEMPIEYRQDDSRRIVVATSSGRVTLDDVLATIDRQASDGAWTYGVLFDARGSDAAPNAADLLALVKHVGFLTTKHGPRGPVAFVAAAAALEKQGRKYASLGALTALDVRIFAELADAERWLKHMLG
jgi:hypothetical protein